VNLAIVNADGISAESAEWEMRPATYQVKKLKQWTAFYDQLISPMMFWNGKGDCQTVENESMKRCTTRIGKILICLALQLRDHFIHALHTLCEQLRCAV
jgi:hypothetical protein